MSKLSCVLLIEDDPISSFISVNSIKLFDICNRIKVVSTGEAALSYLHELINCNESLPELIFIDIQLPNMDGYDLHEKLKKEFFHDKSYSTVVCILTNSNHPNDWDKFRQSGLHEYILKPLTNAKLDLIIKKYFN